MFKQIRMSVCSLCDWLDFECCVKAGRTGMAGLKKAGWSLNPEL